MTPDQEDEQRMAAGFGAAGSGAEIETPRTDRETYTVSAADIGFKVTPVSCAKALEQELNRRKGDPVTRLHNLCAALEEDKNDSPYSAESWELQDRMYADKCADLNRLRTACLAIAKRIRPEGHQGIANELEELGK